MRPRLSGSFTVIPEPGTAALAVLGGATLALALRARRARSLFILLVTAVHLPGSAEALTGEVIEARWTPGDGFYEDASRWVFEPSPSGASIPNDDATNRFDVEIDADGLTPSRVDLQSIISIRDLILGSGDGLHLLSGARLDGRTLVNLGDLEVAPGAELALESLHQPSSLASTRIGAGGLLRATSVRINTGLLRLEGGRVEADRVSFPAFPNARLEGDGTIAADLALGSGVLAPGIGGLGRLDVEGDLTLGSDLTFDFPGVAELDLAGPGTGASDLVAVSGAALLQIGAQIRVLPTGSFTPVAGENYELLRAASVDSIKPLTTVVQVAPPSSDVWLVPVLHTLPADEGEALRLQARRENRATWRGDSGAFEGGSWEFAHATSGTSYPNNGPAELFDVEIDSGGAGIEVSLGGAVEIDSLHLAARDALVLDEASRLVVTETPSRAASGRIVNHGRLAFSSTGGAELLANGALSLEGRGVLDLGPGGSRLAIVDDAPSTLRNGAEHTIRGAGTILGHRPWPRSFRSTLVNEGTLEATEDAPLEVDGDLVNRGTLHARGSGGLLALGLLNEGRVLIEPGSVVGPLFFARMTNRGEIQVARDGALGPVLQDGEAARLDAAGSLSDLDIRAGTARLDDVVVNGNLDVSEDGIVEGTGVVVGRPGSEGALRIGTSPHPTEGGTLRPGLDGPGTIQADYLTLRGRIELEIAGTSAERHDVLRLTRFAALGGEVAVSLSDGFQPVAGDRFEVIHTGGRGIRNAVGVYASGQSFSSAFTMPDLGGGLWLVPRLEGDPLAEGQQLVLVTLGERSARWAGGDGDFATGPWTFNPSPVAAAFPDNSDRELFDVEIDSGGAGVEVSLDRSVEIDGFALGQGDTLRLEDAAELRLTGTPGRPASSHFHNDGRIALAGPGTSAIVATGDLRFEGQGTLDLGERANEVRFVSFGRGTLTNGAGHTIRGSGGLAPDGLTTFVNEGTVEAEGEELLVSRGVVENDGVIHARGPGGLSTGFLVNQGRVLVHEGSRLYANGELENAGTVRVERGGVLYVRRLEQRDPEAETVVAGTLVRYFDGSGFEAGRLRLEGGNVSFDGTSVNVIGAEAVLEGTGSLSSNRSAIRLYGTSRPGLEGIGTLEIFADLDARDGARLEFELAGTAPGTEADLVTILGTSVLRGVLEVELITGKKGGDPFAPALGDRFELIRAGAILDEGLALDLPELAPGLSWLPKIRARGGIDRFVLRVVPEPESAPLVALGLLALALRRRERSTRCPAPVD